MKCKENKFPVLAFVDIETTGLRAEFQPLHGLGVKSMAFTALCNKKLPAIKISAIVFKE
jgi:uncharacterized protein YprB with RNaseH-like and TPR domain